MTLFYIQTLTLLPYSILSQTDQAFLFFEKKLWMCWMWILSSVWQKCWAAPDLIGLLEVRNWRQNCLSSTCIWRRFCLVSLFHPLNIRDHTYHSALQSKGNQRWSRSPLSTNMTLYLDLSNFSWNRSFWFPGGRAESSFWPLFPVWPMYLML